MTAFPLSATASVGEEGGSQCKHYINPTTRCQAPPWKHRANLQWNKLWQQTVVSMWQNKLTLKRKEIQEKETVQESLETEKNIQQTNKDMAILMPISYTVILFSLLCGSQLLKLLTCSNKEWIKFRVIQRCTKCMQEHSSQLAGIFHTIRERFNHTISVNPLK